MQVRLRRQVLNLWSLSVKENTTFETYVCRPIKWSWSVTVVACLHRNFSEFLAVVEVGWRQYILLVTQSALPFSPLKIEINIILVLFFCVVGNICRLHCKDHVYCKRLTFCCYSLQEGHVTFHDNLRFIVILVLHGSWTCKP